MKEHRFCEVSLNGYDCLAPPGYGINGRYAPGDNGTRGTCGRCGQAACTNCTKRMTINGRRMRVCRDCEEEIAK